MLGYEGLASDSTLMADTFCEVNSEPILPTSLSLNVAQEDRIENNDFGVVGGSSFLSQLVNGKHFMAPNKSTHKNFLTADQIQMKKKAERLDQKQSKPSIYTGKLKNCRN